MKINFCPLSILVLALSLAAARALAEDTVPAPRPPALKLGTGFDYSSGDYGFTQDTEVWSVPVNLAYEEPRFAFRATLPFITIKGPASVVAAGGVPGRPTSQSESGLGDVLLSGTYHAHPVPGELNIDLTGRVKLPTADEDKGLGTGKTDYYVQTDLSQAFGDIIPFASIGYRFLGRSAIYPLKDGLYATAGTSYRATPKTIVGGAFDWRSKIIAGSPDGADAFVFVATNPNDRWNLLGYLLKGFNDAAPDYGLGGIATYKF